MVQRVLGEAAAQAVTPSPALAREVLEVMDLGQSKSARKNGSQSASGILSPGMGLIRSKEKVVQAWPSITDRLIVELR
jgi:hypothetical protein